MLTATTSLTTTLTVVSAVATIVAAGSALAAIHFARQTVDESRSARTEAHTYHADEIAAATAATETAAQQHSAQISELQFAALATQSQHEEDMAERARAAMAAQAEERLLQLDRVSALLLEIVDVARDETRDPPDPLGPGITGTRLPAMLMRLANALAVLDALGGPRPVTAGELANRGYSGGSAAIGYVGVGIDALREIQTIIDGHGPLTSEPGGAA